MEICRRLRNHPVRTVMLTGKADEKLATSAFNQGLIDRFVLKHDSATVDRLDELIAELQLDYFDRMRSELSGIIGLQEFGFPGRRVVRPTPGQDSEAGEGGGILPLPHPSRPPDAARRRHQADAAGPARRRARRLQGRRRRCRWRRHAAGTVRPDRGRRLATLVSDTARPVHTGLPRQLGGSPVPGRTGRPLALQRDRRRCAFRRTERPVFSYNAYRRRPHQEIS